MVNCLIWLTPLMVALSHIVTYREYSSIIDTISMFGGFLSVKSSIFSFLITAVERYLAVVKPFWHRVNVTKTYTLRLISCAWIIAVINAVIATYLHPHGRLEGVSIFIISVQALFFMLMLIITLLFGLTFYKALMSIRRPDLSGITLSKKKKEFHLITTFVIMYVTFIACFFPIATNNTLTKSPENYLKFLVFSLTSIINPVLILKLRKEFRICTKLKRQRSNPTNREDVEESQL